MISIFTNIRELSVYLINRGGVSDILNISQGR
jgi:hypothetical protein